jgi:hypothetical protein
MKIFRQFLWESRNPLYNPLTIESASQITSLAQRRRTLAPVAYRRKSRDVCGLRAGPIFEGGHDSPLKRLKTAKESKGNRALFL